MRQENNVLRDSKQTMKIKGAYNLQKVKVEGDNAVANMKNESNKDISAVTKSLSM